MRRNDRSLICCEPNSKAAPRRSETSITPGGEVYPRSSSAVDTTDAITSPCDSPCRPPRPRIGVAARFSHGAPTRVNRANATATSLSSPGRAGATIVIRSVRIRLKSGEPICTVSRRKGMR